MKQEDIHPSPIGRRRLRRILLGLSIAILLFTAVGFWVIPLVAKRVGEQKLSELFHRQVTIEKIRLNPYALSVTVQGLRIRDRDGSRDLFSLRELYINAQLASAFKGGPVIRQVRVVEPKIMIVRTAEDRYNFSDLLDKFSSGQPSPPPPPDAEPARFSISNIELFRGHIELDDQWKATRHTVAGIQISVPFVSNFPYLVDTFVQPAFAATINGTRLAIQGRSKPFADSLESSIDVNLTQVNLPYYLAYLPMKLKPKIRSAVLDTRLKITFVQFRERPARVDISGTLALSQLDVVDDHNRPLLKWPLLEITLDSSDLLANKLAIRRILLDALEVHVRRDSHGKLQLLTLLPTPPGSETTAAKAKAKTTKPQTGQTEKPAEWQIDLGEFKLQKAKIAFLDQSNARPFHTTLEPLNITVTKFSTTKGAKGRVEVSARSSVGESLKLLGRFSATPVAFEGTLSLQSLPLPHYAPFYESQILFDVRSGTLDLSVPIEAAQQGNKLDVVVQGFATQLRQLQLRRGSDREDFLSLPEFSISETNVNLAKNEIFLGKISTSGAKVRVSRGGPAQPWNLETLLPPVPVAPRTAEPSRAAPIAADKYSPAQPFKVTIGNLDLSNASVRIEDRGPRTLAITNLERIGVRAKGLSTEPGKQGQVNVQACLNQTGSILVSGALGLLPLKADGVVRLKAIPVVPVQPYFQDEVALLLTSGHVGVDGRVLFSSGPKGPSAYYRGEVSLGDLVAISPKSADELLRLGSLRISGIDAQTLPLKVDVGEIALSNFAANVVIEPDQTINLAALAAPAEKDAKIAPAPKQSAPATPATNDRPPAIRIGAIVLDNGTIQVTDRSVRPFFGTRLSQLGGRVSGLSFDEEDRAKVDIRGRLGNGPLEIIGQMNPMAKKQYIDLAVKLADMDLSAMTPYAGKYAGYAVEKGQLYLDLKYLIDARQLSAQNNVKIEQFTFGHEVDSKDATNLPVRLAVSLLKDRHGVIRLDLPVTGSLDDPKFSVWGVVLMVLKNLLIKAATSPFALLGAAFGQGEELSWSEFESGQVEVPKAAQAKIDTLAKSLYDRPALRLEIEGHADPRLDLEALRGLELKRRVVAQKMKETVASGSDAKTTPSVSSAEYPKYLKMAYRAEEKIAKPKNALGMLKDIPTSEMERLILGSIVITQDDLRLLARSRAQNVRDRILRAQKIETERIFLVEPKSIAPEPKAKIKNSRVDFRLK